MTRKELIKILFPEVKTDILPCANVDTAKCFTTPCSECNYKNFWNEPAVLSKEAVKSILNSTYGYNACLETNTYFVFGGRNNGKTYAQHLELIQQGWTQLPSIHNNIDWSTLNEIMSDAIVNGFEVKILNGTIYYREK